MRYVRKLVEIDAAHGFEFGESGARLGMLARGGLPVPRGFGIGAEAYREFIAAENIDKTIGQILGGLQVNDPEDVEVRTEQVCNFLNTRQMPEAVAIEVLKGYYELGVEMGSVATPVPVAVRPSSTTRDLPAPSCPAPAESYFKAVGEAELLEKIKRCWGSLWTARAVACRVSQGVDHAKAGVAVMVQELIQTQVSGFFFATNGDQVGMAASRTLGEVITFTLTTPDSSTVREQDGTAGFSVPPDLSRILAASNSQVAELVELGARIEKLCGAPLDFEWAYAGGRVYICDARMAAVGRLT